MARDLAAGKKPGERHRRRAHAARSAVRPTATPKCGPPRPAQLTYSAPATRPQPGRRGGLRRAAGIGGASRLSSSRISAQMRTRSRRAAAASRRQNASCMPGSTRSVTAIARAPPGPGPTRWRTRVSAPNWPGCASARSAPSLRPTSVRAQPRHQRLQVARGHAQVGSQQSSAGSPSSVATTLRSAGADAAHRPDRLAALRHARDQRPRRA